jgi:hypothetical protein
MKLFLKHHLFRILTLSRFLSSSGAYIYNLVFVVYAASLPFKSLAVFVANMITILPFLFTFYVGIKADQTQNKGRMIIWVGCLQSILFLLIAIVIRDSNFFTFAFICLMNICSDVLSDYTAGLRMPIIQYNISEDKLYEAYSFTQFVSYLSNLGGQALGVWILTTSQQNFSLVAIVNSGFFLLSSLILLKNRKELTHLSIIVETQPINLVQQMKTIYADMDYVFRKKESKSLFKIVLVILIMNTLGGAIGGIYHFYLLDHAIYHLSYAQALFLIEGVSLGGAIIGSLTPNDYFGKLSFSNLLSLNALLFVLLAIANVLGFPPLVGIICLAFVMYFMSKSMPKLDTLLLSNLSSDVLARSNNFLSMIFSLTLPLGMSLFSFLALQDIRICWWVFVAVSVIGLILSLGNNRNE